MHDTSTTSAGLSRASGKSRTPDFCAPVINLVARRKRIPARLLTHDSRCFQDAARARQLAMYLSHVVLGRTLTEIGHAFRRDRTTVSYACALIEDMRDDPAFDAEVTQFEHCLEVMLNEGRADG